MSKTVGAVSRPALLVADSFNFLLALLPSLLSYIIAFQFIQMNLWSSLNIWSLLAYVPASIFIFIFIVFFFRLLLPKLKPGIYPVGLHWRFAIWSMHLYLARAVELHLFKKAIFSFHSTRYLLFRALGTKLPFNVICSLNVSVVDHPLIEIGGNVTLTEGVTLSAHTIVKNKLWLKKIYIGENTYVGTNSLIGLGTVIGENCSIGPYNILMSDKLVPGSALDAFQWQRGNPDKKHNRRKS
jgi:hypothetical protein